MSAPKKAQCRDNNHVHVRTLERNGNKYLHALKHVECIGTAAFVWQHFYCETDSNLLNFRKPTKSAQQSTGESQLRALRYAVVRNRLLHSPWGDRNELAVAHEPKGSFGFATRCGDSPWRPQGRASFQQMIVLDGILRMNSEGVVPCGRGRLCAVYTGTELAAPLRCASASGDTAMPPFTQDGNSSVLRWGRWTSGAATAERADVTTTQRSQESLAQSSAVDHLQAYERNERRAVHDVEPTDTCYASLS